MWLVEMAKDELGGHAKTEVHCSSSAIDWIIERAADVDLLVLGTQRVARYQKFFGETALRIARQTSCGLILINRKG